MYPKNILVEKNKVNIAKQAISDMEEAKGVVKHILVVKFKEDTKQERIEELIKEFAGLREIIKSIKDFTWGKDLSTANLTKGNTHVFQVTFESMEDVEAYMAHEAHMAFAQQLLGATDSVILMDYKPISAGKKKTCCLPFSKGVVKHILVVKFKEDTKQERIEELIKEFAELREVIKSIKDFTWGKDVSTANLNKGNTHVFQVTFESMEDVEAYMAHEAHMAFAQQLLGATDSVILMDYKPTSAGKKKTGYLPCPLIMGPLLIAFLSYVFYFIS